MTLNLQAPPAVVMIRPHHFSPNPSTANDNGFQSTDPDAPRDVVAQRAHRETSIVAEVLTAQGIDVHVFEDHETDRPDSVFPNNWFSTHPGGNVAIYPMYSANRRRERRVDIIDALKQQYRVQEVSDFSGLEEDGIYLEGTGAMVLDHVTRVAYACESNRTSPIALERFCTRFSYEPMAFRAVDSKGLAVYHTNVLMCIATEFALVGLELIPDQRRRQEVEARLAGPGRQVIALTERQIGCFAGNALELEGAKGRFLALSSTALSSLTSRQRTLIEASASIVSLDIPTIELAGGSLRCMLAGIHLEPRVPSPVSKRSRTPLSLPS